MTTDNRTNEPTETQVEAAAKAMWDLRKLPSDPEWAELEYGVKQEYRKDARAALVAAQGAAPQDSGKCGGCRDLGPHRNVPGCQYYEAPVLPSSGVDEDALAEVIASARNRWAIFGRKDELLELYLARAVAEWLRARAAEIREGK